VTASLGVAHGRVPRDATTAMRRTAIGAAAALNSRMSLPHGPFARPHRAAPLDRIAWIAAPTFLRHAMSPSTSPRALAADAEKRSTAPRAADGAQLLDALRAIARELRVSGRETEQRLGVHPAQLHVLQRLAERPARSLAELAERTHTDPSSASVVVQRLVERGMVARVAAADDRRRTELSLTAAGRAIVRRAPVSAAQRLDEALGSLGDRDGAALVRTLTSLARTLRSDEEEE